MARAALSRRLTWQLGRVVEIVRETPRAVSIVLDLPDWPGHRAGQHVDVRLTAEDGYQAQRGYSIASAPEDEHVVLTVERLDDGEVSPYLVDVLQPGDELEVRGPIGGYFIWEPSLPGALAMVAGGSGVVPFRAMLRHWAATGRPVPARLVLSARSLEDMVFRSELERLEGLDLRVALTRAWPDDWAGHRGRLDGEAIARAVPPASEAPQIYICGPTGFVEAAAEALVTAGHPGPGIRTERFGGS